MSLAPGDGWLTGRVAGGVPGIFPENYAEARHGNGAQEAEVPAGQEAAHAAPEEAEQLWVTVPDGMESGEEVVVTTAEGRALTIALPAGSRPGESFLVHVDTLGSVSVGELEGTELGRRQALHDYQSAEEGDLEFKAGDTIDVVSLAPGDGWLTGRVAGSVPGIFPENYTTQ